MGLTGLLRLRRSDNELSEPPSPSHVYSQKRRSLGTRRKMSRKNKTVGVRAPTSGRKEGLRG